MEDTQVGMPELCATDDYQPTFYYGQKLVVVGGFYRGAKVTAIAHYREKGTMAVLYGVRLEDSAEVVVKEADLAVAS
jgi:hypothetical protein